MLTDLIYTNIVNKHIARDLEDIIAIISEIYISNLNYNFFCMCNYLKDMWLVEIKYNDD